jgi:hypothetical protein
MYRKLNLKAVSFHLSVIALVVMLLATGAMAQTPASPETDDWGTSEPPKADSAKQRSGGTRFFDEESIRGYADFVGFYGQFGVSVGEIEFDGSPDVDAGGGFSVTAGYRFLPWLSAEGNVSYLGGGDANLPGQDREADFFAFTFGPKIYPLGLLEEQPIPEFIQPYGLVGIGGGEYDIDRTGSEESTFIARFIFGFDVWVTDEFGLFMEGGYHVAGDGDIDGTGLFTVGGQYRF